MADRSQLPSALDESRRYPGVGGTSDRGRRSLVKRATCKCSFRCGVSCGLLKDISGWILFVNDFPWPAALTRWRQVSRAHREVDLPVFAGKEYVRAPITAMGHVTGLVNDDNPCKAWHESIRILKVRQMQKESLHVPIFPPPQFP